MKIEYRDPDYPSGLNEEAENIYSWEIYNSYGKVKAKNIKEAFHKVIDSYYEGEKLDEDVMYRIDIKIEKEN